VFSEAEQRVDHCTYIDGDTLIEVNSTSISLGIKDIRKSRGVMREYDGCLSCEVTWQVP
jgi:hypothetical protein